MVLYRKVLYASVSAYNEGLARAQVRDLTGALECLHRSLRFDKYNTMARNLLGLVYYEMGQMSLALREWVVSKNFQQKDNPVDAFLEEAQKPGMLNRLDQTAQKFNQSLAYCQRNSKDLALIQLKRIVRSNPKMIEAYQLLALLLIDEGKYDEARKHLLAAARIDVKNPVTLEYLEEIRRNGKPSRRKRRSVKNASQQTTSSAAEIAPLPRSGFLDILDSNCSGLINILVGCVLGILVAIFLIDPTLRQNENNDAQNALVSANKEAADTANTVTGLKKQVKSLKKELKQYTGKGNLKESYEKLLEAEAAMADEDMEAAGDAISQINDRLLDARGQELYTSISTTIGEQIAEEAYKDGTSAFRARRYEDAVTALLRVVEFDPEYEEGGALYTLAQAYEYAEDEANAARYYAQYAGLFPNTSRGNEAASKAEELGVPEGSEEDGSLSDENDGAQTGGTTNTTRTGGTTTTTQTGDTTTTTQTGGTANTTQTGDTTTTTQTGDTANTTQTGGTTTTTQTGDTTTTTQTGGTVDTGQGTGTNDAGTTATEAPQTEEAAMPPVSDTTEGTDTGTGAVEVPTTNEVGGALDADGNMTP
ncbi:MAG: hypothetical protein IJV04_04180 [Lachnospiraceae bacterium]|nr:hypothetical protein [Lachnospiraceae bacterium]